MLSGINRVAAAQRGYLLTQVDTFRTERLENWKNQIYPAFQELEDLKGSGISEDNQAKLDTIKSLLVQYEDIQERIDDFLVEELVEEQIKGSLQASDSLEMQAFLDQMNIEQEKRAELLAYVSKDATHLRNKLRALLMPIATESSASLDSRIVAIEQAITQINLQGLIVSFLAIILFLGLIYFLNRMTVKAVGQATTFLEQLSEGKIPEPVQETKLEINSILVSGNQLASNLEKASEFAKNIGEERFDTAYQPASEEDVLGIALLEMQQKLKDSALKDQQKKWMTEGIAQLGELLRDNQGDLQDWYFSLISFIVHYLDLNQGGIYVLENTKEEEAYIQLKACLAFERRKFLEVKLDPREGLIGQAVQEQAMVYIKELPEAYLSIRSGLGDASPNTLVIVPMLYNEEVNGVLELAGFRALEKYQLELLETFAISIAASIFNVRTSEETKRLLRLSDVARESLRSAEEELRQNLEELTATQEASARNQEIMDSIFNQAMDSIVTISTEGKIDMFNGVAEKVFGYTHEEVQGKNVKMLMPDEYSHAHDSYLSRYQETQEKHVIGQARKVKGMRKDGSVFPLEIRIEEIRYGANVMYVGVLIDLTERHQKDHEAEQSLLLEKQKAEEQINLQKRMMEKVKQNFEVKEKELVALVEAQETRIKELEMAKTSSNG